MAGVHVSINEGAGLVRISQDARWTCCNDVDMDEDMSPRAHVPGADLRILNRGSTVKVTRC